MCMCFGKKHAPAPPLQISSPLSVVHEKVTFSFNGQSYTPPYEPYDKKYTLRPITPTSRSWGSQDSQVSTRCSSPARPKKSKKWFRVPKNKRMMFRNAGLDSHGRLKMDYVHLTTDDWGTPDEWNKEGKSSCW